MDTVFFPLLVAIFIVAPIGGIDAFYFHSVKYQLYKNPDSRMEQATHIFRSFLLGVIVFVLIYYQPQGAWFWGVGALFVLDFLNNIIDVSIEYASREKLGGLQRIEYIIHIIGASCMGGVTFGYFALGWHLGDLPTALVPITHHTLVFWAGFLVAIGAVLGGLSETFLTLKYWRLDSIDG